MFLSVSGNLTAAVAVHILVFHYSGSGYRLYVLPLQILFHSGIDVFPDILAGFFKGNMQNAFSKNGASGIQENLGISFQYKVTAKFKPPVSVPGSRKECFVCQRGFCLSGGTGFSWFCAG